MSRVLLRSSVLLAALPLASGAARAQCPLVISAAGTTTLSGDVVCPPGYVGDGIRIDASNATLDGAGFSVVLDTSGTGVHVSSGRSGVTIEDLTVAPRPAPAAVTGILIGRSTNLTIQDCVLSGLATGIDSLAGRTNPGLVIRRTDVSGASTYGMYLRGVDGGFVLEDNVFDGDSSGLVLGSNTAPFVLGGTNRFVGVGSAGTDAVELTQTTGATVTGLVVGPGSGYALHLHRTASTTVTGAVLTGHDRGVYASGSTDNTDLTITDTDVSGSTEYGMYLDSVTSSLVLERDRFDGSTNGLRLQDLVGPWSLSATNSFVGVGQSEADHVLWIVGTTAVTVSGLDLSDTRGVGVGIYLDSTVSTTLSGNDVSGHYNGINTRSTPANSVDLRVVGNDASGSAGYGIVLDGADPGLVLTGNRLDGSADGLDLEGIAFPSPWTLDPSNTFAGAGTVADGSVVRLVDTSNVVVQGLDLHATSGVAYGVRVVGSSNLVVRGNDLSGREFGIFAEPSASQANSGTIVEDNDVSGASTWGMWLEGFDGTLQLRRNDFSGDASGLRLASTDGPLTIDLAGSDFTGAANASGLRAVRVTDSTDVVVANLTARLGGIGTALYVDASASVGATGLLVCDANLGAALAEDSLAAVQGQIGHSHIAVANGQLCDGTAVDVAFGGNGTDVTDLGTNTTVAAEPTLPDADADGNPDLCDPCPNDPLNDADGDGICDPFDLCTGEDTTGDADADGWCADLDCDDGNADVYPGAPELCDGLDDDCDGEVDEGAAFRDDDADTCGDCAVGPYDPGNDGPDFDGDGLCDAGDPDDDDDTVVDGEDVAPLDPTRCRDLDTDTCDDCSQVIPPDTFDDGPDADGDGICDAVDLQCGDKVFDRSQVSWTTGGTGSPTVVYDRTAGQFVMVFETQTGGTSASCPHGVWSLGLATSPTGRSWTDSGAPLLDPVPGTPYGCVVAHPTIVQHDGITTVFFKEEAENGVYSGVGRILLSWNGGGYDATAPDPTPALPLAVDFGYPKAVWNGTTQEYELTFTERPSMYTAHGGGASLLGPNGPVLSPGFAPGAPDEVFNPAFSCDATGTYVGLVGGHDLFKGRILGEAMERVTSPDFATWGPAAAALQTSPPEPEMKHWDVLRLANDDVLVWYDLQVAGKNEVHLGCTDPLWSVADVLDKTCP